MSTEPISIQEIKDIKKDDLWAEIPEFPRASWREEVTASDTQLGYWDWVESQILQKYED